MKKLVALGGGLAAAGTLALFGAANATSQPDNSGYNVVGEPYLKAVSILKSQGIKATFGGSVGSVLPQSQCLVSSQKVSSSRKLILQLDCSQAAADLAAETANDPGVPGGRTVGSNGVTTVTPTPVVPVPGAPGAGMPVMPAG